MKLWTVEFHDEFDDEMLKFPEPVQDRIIAMAKLLAEVGPQLGRPRSDTLKGSKFPNMKELRFDASDGVWRVAYAFDVRRAAILLAAGDKSGTSSRRFYASLIRRADERFEAHLKQMI